MDYTLRIKIKNSLFYLLSCLFIAICFFLVRYVFLRYGVDEMIFITFSAILFPLSIIYEDHFTRISIIQYQNDLKNRSNPFYLEIIDQRAIEGIYSQYSLVVTFIINCANIIFRLIYPESISLESTVLSVILIVGSLYINIKYIT
jgi:hypothetical protein